MRQINHFKIILEDDFRTHLIKRKSQHTQSSEALNYANWIKEI